MYNFIYIFRYLLSVFLTVTLLCCTCFAYVDKKIVDLSCSSIDFRSCVKLIERELNIFINIDTGYNVDSIVNVDISNATLYDSLNAIFKQAKIRNYYISYDDVSSACDVKIFDGSYNQRNKNSLNLKNDISDSDTIKMNGFHALENNENMTNGTFSSDSLKILEKETQIILDNSNKPDIFVQKDYLDRLQAETDKLVQQEKISESNILPEHLEMLHKVDSEAHVETEMSGEDLEVLKTLN